MYRTEETGSGYQVEDVSVPEDEKEREGKEMNEVLLARIAVALEGINDKLECIRIPWNSWKSCLTVWTSLCRL